MIEEIVIDELLLNLMEEKLSSIFGRSVRITNCNLALADEKRYDKYMHKHPYKDRVRMSLEVGYGENIFAHGGIDDDVEKFIRKNKLTPGINFTVHSSNKLSKDGVLWDRLAKCTVPAHIYTATHLGIL